METETKKTTKSYFNKTMHFSLVQQNTKVEKSTGLHYNLIIKK